MSTKSPLTSQSRVNIFRRDAAVLVAHIIPVLLLAIMVNIPKFLESEVRFLTFNVNEKMDVQ